AAATETRLAIPGDIPREADTRTEVVDGRIRAVLRHAGIPAEQLAARRRREPRRVQVLLERLQGEIFDAADLLVPRRRRLETRAEVQGQAVRRLEIVLEEQRSVVRHVVLVLPGPLVEAAQLPQQEVRECVSGAGRRAAGELEMPGAAELIADFHRVSLPFAAE